MVDIYYAEMKYYGIQFSSSFQHPSLPLFLPAPLVFKGSIDARAMNQHCLLQLLVSCVMAVGVQQTVLGFLSRVKPVVLVLHPSPPFRSVSLPATSFRHETNPLPLVTSRDNNSHNSFICRSSHELLDNHASFFNSQGLKGHATKTC